MSNIPNMSKKFLEEIDHYLANNYQNLTCDDIHNMYFQFFLELKEFKGNSNGFTGLSEYLIFRFLYHFLGGKFDRRRIPDSNELWEFISFDNNLRIGQSTPISAPNRKYYPDIVIYEFGKLTAIIEIKIYFSGGIKQIAQEIERLEQLRKPYPEAKILLIVFGGLSTAGKILPNLEKVRTGKQWFNFLSLKENNELFEKTLQQCLSLERIKTIS